MTPARTRAVVTPAVVTRVVLYRDALGRFVNLDSEEPIPPDTVSQTSVKPSGTRSLIAAATAILGVMAAVFPDVPVFAAISAAAPQLKEALPVVVTAIGSIIAALSAPPKLR